MLSIAVVVVAAACGDDPYPIGDDAGWSENSEDSGPRVVATGQSIVQIGHRSRELVVVRPSSGTDIAVERHGLDGPKPERSGGIYQLAALGDGSGVLALRGGLFDDAPPTLVHLAADPGATPVEYALDGAYTSISLTPDHRRAILYYGDESEHDAQGLHNANQFTVIDLGSTTLEPRTATVDGFGGRLRSVQFPGQQQPGEISPVDIGGVARDLAVFLASEEIVLHDLDDPGATQVAVQLPTTTEFEPEQTLLRAGDENFDRPVLFVRSSSSADLAMLTLVEKADGEAQGFSAHVSLLPVGAGVTDMVHVNAGGVGYLAAVRGETLVFSNIGTQQNHELALGWRAAHIELRTNQDGDQVAEYELLTMVAH